MHLYHHLISEINNLSFKCHYSLGSKVSPQGPTDVRKVSRTFDNHYPSLCGGRNNRSNGIHLEAQLQLREKLCLGDDLNEGIIG